MTTEFELKLRQSMIDDIEAYVGIYRAVWIGWPTAQIKRLYDYVLEHEQ